MSRWRLDKRLRKNPDFEAMTRFLDGVGLKWQVVKPNEKGHPALEVTSPDGIVVVHYIASTPHMRGNSDGALARLKRKLRGHSISC